MAQVALGLGIPAVLGVALGSATDAADYRPSAVCLVVVVVLAVFSGPWAALTAALTSTLVIDLTLIDRQWWLVPGTWSEAAGLLIVFTAAMTTVVLVYQRERARAAAVDSEARQAATSTMLDAMLTNTPVGFGFVDPHQRFVMGNDALAEAFGVDGADLRAGTHHVSELLGDEGGAVVTKAMAGGLPISAEMDVERSAGGAARHLMVSAYQVGGAEGRALGAGVTVVDVTDRTHLQGVLLELQDELAADRFRLALDSLPDLVAIQRSVHDEDGVVVDFVMEFLNHPDLPVGDFQRRELVGRRLLEVFPEFAGSNVFEAMVSVATTGRPHAVIDNPVTVRATGETDQRFATVQVAPFGDGIIAVVSDVTERQHNLQRIERANAELAAAQHLAHIGLWRVDLEQQLLLLSDEAAEIVGGTGAGERPWTPGMLLDLLDASDRARVANLIGAAEGGAFATEAQLLQPDGSTRLVSIFGQVVGESEPQGPEVWGTIQDLTDQRRQEWALREARDRLAEERATVALLQEAIVPVLPEGETVEVGATYLAAGEASLVGGDWYDAFMVDSDRLIFAVGDVAGHGLPAAAFMGQLRNALRGLAFAGLAIDEILSAMNRMVVQGSNDEMATCIIGELVPSTGSISWVSAGHPPPLALDPAVGGSLLDTSVTVPLGVRPVAAVPVNRSRLPPGALVVLYSDGLVERRGEILDVGLDRLVDVATRHRLAGAQALCDSLTEDLVGGAAPNDDLCVLAFRVPPGPIPEPSGG